MAYLDSSADEDVNLSTDQDNEGTDYDDSESDGDTNRGRLFGVCPSRNSRMCKKSKEKQNRAVRVEELATTHVVDQSSTPVVKSTEHCEDASTSEERPAQIGTVPALSAGHDISISSQKALHESHFTRYQILRMPTYLHGPDDYLAHRACMQEGSPRGSQT